MASTAGPDGILLVDKPQGITSHDVVAKVRRACGTRKVGHAGTLDPMATGLLVLGVGRATRLLRYLSGMDKTYEGSGRLGITTDTLDADGTETSRADASRITIDALGSASDALVGVISQVPPAYSAVKVDGEALYKAARRGETKEVPPRDVTIARFEIAVGPGLPAFDFAVDCSSGTYVRTLIDDLGSTLGCGAHLTRLRRTRIGPFDLTDAVAPDDPGTPLPIERAVAHLPRFELDANEAEAVGYGRPLVPAGIDGPFGVYDPSGALLGMYRDQGSKSVPEMILAPAAQPSDVG